MINPYPGNRRGGVDDHQFGFCRQSPSRQWNETAIFVTFRFYVAGLDPRDWFSEYQHCTPMKQRYKLHRCDIFENGKMTRQEYKERYLYIFKTTDKTGSIVIGHHLEYAVIVTDSYSRINRSKYYCNSSAVKKFSTRPNSKNVSTKMRHWTDNRK